AVAEKKRLIAERGVERSIDLGLRFTNRGDKALRLNLADTIRPVLKYADGKEVKVSGGRRETYPVEPVLVAPGKSDTVRWRARVESLKNKNAFRLTWTDGTGFVWTFDEVATGKYFLHFEYENTRGEKFWTGKATTNDVEFVILTADRAK